MDRGQFDALARLVGARQSRRTALATLLGATFLRANVPTNAAKRKGKKKTQERRSCFAGRTCIPGQGKNNAGCDFSGSTLFQNRNAQGSKLTGANFRGAIAAGANFQGADLGNACFVDADLSDAVIDGSTKLKGAVNCRTTLPDGSIDNSGCDRGTSCCPTCADNQPCPAGLICCDGQCRRDACPPQGGDSCQTRRDCQGNSCVVPSCVNGRCFFRARCQPNELCCNGQCHPGGNCCPPTFPCPSEQICCEGTNVCAECCGAGQSTCAAGKVCCNGHCVECCGSGQSTCGAGRLCCGNQCVTGNCCATGDCPNRACQSRACTGNQCVYTNLPNNVTTCISNRLCCEGVCCPPLMGCTGTPGQCCPTTGCPD